MTNKIVEAIVNLSRALQEQRIKPPEYIALHSQEELLHISDMIQEDNRYLYPSNRTMDVIRENGEEYISIQVYGVELRAPATKGLMTEILRVRFNTTRVSL